MKFDIGLKKSLLITPHGNNSSKDDLTTSDKPGDKLSYKFCSFNDGRYFVNNHKTFMNYMKLSFHAS